MTGERYPFESPERSALRELLASLHPAALDVAAVAKAREVLDATRLPALGYIVKPDPCRGRHGFPFISARRPLPGEEGRYGGLILIGHHRDTTAAEAACARDARRRQRESRA